MALKIWVRSGEKGISTLLLPLGIVGKGKREKSRNLIQLSCQEEEEDGPSERTKWVGGENKKTLAHPQDHGPSLIGGEKGTIFTHPPPPQKKREVT